MKFHRKIDDFTRRRRRGTCVHYMALVASAVLHLCGVESIPAPPPQPVAAYSDYSGQLFSPEWVRWYTSAKAGCDIPRIRYVWRRAGLGSNLMFLMDQLVNGLAMYGMADVGMVVYGEQLGMVNCTGSSQQVLHGYDCLFLPMAHVCRFDSVEDWADGMKASGVPSRVAFLEAQKVTSNFIKTTEARAALFATLERHGTDFFGAISVLTRILWDNLTPWLKEDARKLAEQSATDAFGRFPYIALHIRRGDKIREHEMVKTETVDYLKAAMHHLEDADDVNQTPACEIRGIWVASDDSNAVHEVRALVSSFFPNVQKEDVVWLTVQADKGKAVTHSTALDYAGLVSIIADIQLLAGADMFVGTFTSNISRMAALLRATNGKSKESSISLDEKEFKVYYNRTQG